MGLIEKMKSQALSMINLLNQDFINIKTGQQSQLFSCYQDTKK